MNTLGTLAILVAVAAGLILICIKQVRVLGVSLLIIAIGTATYILHRDREQGLASSRIVLGASEAEVVLALGTPPRVTDGSEWVSRGFKRNPEELIPGCVREFWYGAFFFPYQESF